MTSIHKMAEAIGVVAGAFQFLDLGCRVVMTLSRLCSDLQHVPRKIQKAIRQLEASLDIVRAIKEDVDAPNMGPGTTLAGMIPPNRIIAAVTLLEDGVREMKELESILKTLMVQKEDGFIKRGWKAIVSVKKEDDILDRCENLEGIKSSLELWLQHQSLTLLKDSVLADEKTDWNIHTIDQRIQELPDTVKDISRTSETTVTQHISREFDTTRTQLHCELEDIYLFSKHTNATLDELRNTMQTKAAADEAAQNALMSEIKGLQMVVSQRLIAKPSYLEEIGNINTIDSQSQAAAVYGTVDGRLQACVPASSYRLRCSCTTKQVRTFRSWGSLYVEQDPRHAHQPQCSLYRRSQRSLTLGIKAVLPKLFAYSLEAAFRISFGAGGMSMNLANLRAARVVDLEKSPALKAIKTLWNSLGGPTKGSQMGLEVQLNMEFDSLARTLVQLFEAGKASAYDQDEYGTTLLHRFIAWLTELPHYGPTRRKLIATHIPTILKLLVEYGADVNAYRLTSKAERLGISTICRAVSEGTMLDTYLASARPILGRLPGDYNTGISFASIIQGLGGEAFCTSYKECTSAGVIWQCTTNPEIVTRKPSLSSLPKSLPNINFQGIGFPEYYLSVFEKSMPDLEDAIKKGRHKEEPSDEMPSLLACALFWPQGIRRLLSAGADPSKAVEHAIRLYLPDALRQVLTEDCSFFGNSQYLGDGASLLSIWQNFGCGRWPDTPLSPQQHQTLELILQHLASSRRKLLSFALNTLPPAEIEVLGLTKARNNDQPLDEGALDTYKALERRGVYLPNSIWPGTHISVYHLKEMSALAAEMLWDLGFRDPNSINAEPEDGLTPLSMACHKNKPPDTLIHWYLDRDAKPNKHDYQTYLRNSTWHNDIEGIFPRLWHGWNGRSHDACTCYCSGTGHGCTATTMLAKWPGRAEKWVLEAKPADKQARGIEWCRVEVFKRLGMAHTCCQVGSIAENRLSPPPMEEQEEMRSEDHELADALDGYVSLFEELAQATTKPFEQFWHSWWGALKLFLPEVHENWAPLKDASLHQRGIHRPGISIDEKGYHPDRERIRSVVERYTPALFTAVARYLSFDKAIHTPRSLRTYLQLAGISETATKWMNDEDLDSPDVQKCGHDAMYLFSAFHSSNEYLKRRYWEKVVVPLAAVMVCHDLAFGEDIPAGLLEHLEAEGLAENGRFCEKSSVEPEYVFIDRSDSLLI